jgi:hypothetical protein
MDTVRDRKTLPLIEEAFDPLPHTPPHFVSAATRAGVDELRVCFMPSLLTAAEQSVKLVYPPTLATAPASSAPPPPSLNAREAVSQSVLARLQEELREAMFLNLRREVPYAVMQVGCCGRFDDAADEAKQRDGEGRVGV